MLIEDGSKIIQKIKEIFSDVKYELPKTIKVNWLDKDGFEANASTSSDNNKHSINISYGIPICIIKHAVEFTYICKDSYSTEDYDSIFSKLDYNNGETRYVLPRDLTGEVAAKTLLEYSLSWLYLHEQAHLFQSHGSIFSQVAENKETNFNVSWNENFFTDIDEYQFLSEHDACVKHTFELSADYEATYLIIKFLQKNKIITCSSIWILLAGLTYLFHKFYATKRTYYKGTVKGTHPDPTVRIRMIYLQLLATFEDSNMEECFEENKTLHDYEKTMEHALFTAMLYCEQHYNEDFDEMEFMDRIFDYDSDANKKYMQKIKGVWDEIRPNIVKEYFGHSEKSILPSLK